MFACRFDMVQRNLNKATNLPTKRQIFQIIMSIYDPLGLLNHFTIRAKILMQSVWRRATLWDEVLSEEDLLE